MAGPRACTKGPQGASSASTIVVPAIPRLPLLPQEGGVPYYLTDGSLLFLVRHGTIIQAHHPPNPSERVQYYRITPLEKSGGTGLWPYNMRGATLCSSLLLCGPTLCSAAP